MEDPIKIERVSFEHHPDGFGVGLSKPRISWQFATSMGGPKGWIQDAYEIEIAPDGGSKPDLSRVETFRTQSASSVLNSWPARPLKSRERVYVRVKVRGVSSGRSHDQHLNHDTDWSEWYPVEAALVQPDQWTGKLITGPWEIPDGKPIRPLRFKRLFDCPDFNTQSHRARLYITSHGVYEANLNGSRVGDHYMAPGWTSYAHRLNYQVFDITELLNANKTNTIGVEVAEGWYAGKLTWVPGVTQIYGKEIALLAQLEIVDRDGHVVYSLPTDESWRCSESAILTSEIYDGEVYDMREEKGQWMTDLSYDASHWSSSKLLEFPKSTLIAPDAPPVRKIQKIEPKKIWESPAGKSLIDFGQNIVGTVCVHSLRLEAGQQIQFHHAEALEDGELALRALRTAKACDTVIFSNEELLNWSPKFTFHGFRYVQVDGWKPQNHEISAWVIHSDMMRTGNFKCSSEMVNQLHENVLWSMRGNFLSIPTDCPQRDERLGWTGDIQAFAPTASFLYDTSGMLGSWLEDLYADQKDADGIVPLVIPNVLRKSWPSVPQAVWDDAAIIVPWTLYQTHGDPEILRRQYASMTLHLDKAIQRGEDGLWDPDLWQLADWLDPNAPPDDPGHSFTNGTLVADTYLVYITGLVSQISSILSHHDAATRYQSDFTRLKQLFQDKYITKTGLIVGDTQTSLSLALVFSLFSTPSQTSTASTRLAQLVRYSRFKVSTGFAGTPVILHALSGGGGNHHLQLAYRMLLEKQCPSWLYPITMGATTIWERWDSMLPSGAVNPGQMTSFNHYALGAVANWLHNTVAGLVPLPEHPGWKKFMIRPRPGGTLRRAGMWFLSPYGRIELIWYVFSSPSTTPQQQQQQQSQQQQQHCFELDIRVPPNTSAVVVLPSSNSNSQSNKDQGGEGQAAGGEEGFEVGSGRYHFECPYSPPGEWPPKAMGTEFREGEIGEFAE